MGFINSPHGFIKSPPSILAFGFHCTLHDFNVQKVRLINKGFVRLANLNKIGEAFSFAIIIYLNFTIATPHK
jgi:hypothetical protein